MSYSLLRNILLLERNVENLDEINQFVAQLQQRARTDAGKTWLARNLRNWIINNYKNVTPARVTPDSPDWLVGAVGRGEKVYTVQFDDRFRQEMEHVVDYLNDLKTTTAVNRISVPQAIKNADKWTKQLAKQGAKIKDTEVGTVAIMQFDDGSKIVKLESDAAFKKEGNEMGHCVGSYCKSYEEGRLEIYSLRGPNGEPHATMEIKGKGKLNGREIDQVKGKQNREPIQKYWKYIWDFIAKYNLNIRYDYENIGLFKINNKLYPYTRLPKNAKVHSLNLSKLSDFTLPEGLTVDGDLDVHSTPLDALPKGLSVKGSLYASNTNLATLPDNLTVGEDLRVDGSKFAKMPKGLKVGDDFVLFNTPYKGTEKDVRAAAEVGGEVLGAGGKAKAGEWVGGHYIA